MQRKIVKINAAKIAVQQYDVGKNLSIAVTEPVPGYRSFHLYTIMPDESIDDMQSVIEHLWPEDEFASIKLQNRSNFLDAIEGAIGAVQDDWLIQARIRQPLESIFDGVVSKLAARETEYQKSTAFQGQVNTKAPLRPHMERNGGGRSR